MKPLVAAFLATMLAATAAASNDGRALQWSELVPAGLTFDDPFRKLTVRQLRDLRIVAIARASDRSINNPSKTWRGQLDNALGRLRKSGVNADALLDRRAEITAKRRRAAETAVQQLDRQRISLRGFVLPVASREGRVTEMLLVPTIGACIHEPVPNANQIVRVTLARGIKIESRFAAVRVSGLLRTRTKTTNLYYVDGAARVRSAYEIGDAGVELLKRKVGCRNPYAPAKKIFGVSADPTCEEDKQ